MIKASIPLESPKLFSGIPLDDVIGGLLFLIAMLIYWFGSYTFTPLEIHMFALPVFFSACILLIFNLQMLRQLLFPIMFLFLLVPPPAEILYNLGAFMSMTSSELAFHMMAGLGFPVSLSSKYGTPAINVVQQSGSTIRLVVDVACSGIYSQIGFLIFALFIAYITRDKTWKKATIFLVGFPLIFLLNSIRIFTIGVIGYYYGEAMALEVFHLFGGWVLIFLGTIILLVISEKIFRIRMFSEIRDKCSIYVPLSIGSTGFCSTCGRVKKMALNNVRLGDVAKAVMLVAAAGLVLSIQTPVFALTKGPPEIVVQTATGEQVSTEILPEIPEHTLRFIYRDEEFEKNAGQEASLIYGYYPDNTSEETVWVTIEIASAKTVLHRWETCLITWPIRQGYQPWVREIEQADVELLENPPIIGRYFIFQKRKSNLTQAVLYWYESAVFQVDSSSKLRHVKISLIAYPNNPEVLAPVKEQLLEVAMMVASYWQPIKTWSPIALIISRNGDRLVFTSSVLLLGVALIYTLEREGQMKQNRRAYKKLSRDHRHLATAVRIAEKNGQATLGNIQKVYQKITENLVSKEGLLEKLRQIEKLDIVKQQILNVNDEPIQTWRTQLFL